MNVEKMFAFNKKFIAFFASLFVVSACFCQEISVPKNGDLSEEEKVSEADSDKMILTIEDAVNYSLENSTTLKTAQIDLALAKLKKDNAWNTFLPTVQVTGTMSRTNDINSSIKSANAQIEANKKLYEALGQASGGAAGAIYQNMANNMHPQTAKESMAWTAMGNLSVSLNFNVAMIQSMKATIASYESGKITYEQALRDNEKSIRQLFYALLLQQESLNLQKDSLENARQRMVQAQTNYRNGYVSQLAYLQAQVSYENQVPTISKLEQQMRQSLDSFAFLIGLPIEQKIQLQGEINPKIIQLNQKELIEKGLNDNLTIRSLKENLNILKLQSKSLGLSTYTPSLALSWNGQPMITNAFENSWAEKDNWRDNGAFSFTLAWNLTNMLPWSSTQVSIKELDSNIKKLTLQLEQIQHKTELDIKTAVDTLKQCESAIETSQRNVDLAQRSYNMTWIAYQNGTTEFLNLKEAQTQLDMSKLSLVSEKYNYMSSLMDLENILNTTLTGEN